MDRMVEGGCDSLRVVHFVHGDWSFAGSYAGTVVFAPVMVAVVAVEAVAAVVVVVEVAAVVVIAVESAAVAEWMVIVRLWVEVEIAGADHSLPYCWPCEVTL